MCSLLRPAAGSFLILFLSLAGCARENLEEAESGGGAAVSDNRAFEMFSLRPSSTEEAQQIVRLTNIRVFHLEGTASLWLYEADTLVLSLNRAGEQEGELYPLPFSNVSVTDAKWDDTSRNGPLQLRLESKVAGVAPLLVSVGVLWAGLSYRVEGDASGEHRLERSWAPVPHVLDSVLSTARVAGPNEGQSIQRWGRWRSKYTELKDYFAIRNGANAKPAIYAVDFALGSVRWTADGITLEGSRGAERVAYFARADFGAGAPAELSFRDF
jgi:hypothetical protein